jgi:hypothetical protein
VFWDKLRDALSWFNCYKTESDVCWGSNINLYSIFLYSCQH